MIKEARLIALEGSHGRGKTTLVHGVVGELKSRGIPVGAQFEGARDNPIIQAVRLHNQGEVDVFGQLSLLGEKLSAEAKACQHGGLVVTDKTIVNTLGYARLLLDTDRAFDHGILEAMFDLCRAYASVYDLVVLLDEPFELGVDGDPFRPADNQFQADAAQYIRSALDEVGLQYEVIPQGYTHAQRVSAVVAMIEGVVE